MPSLQDSVPPVDVLRVGFPAAGSARRTPLCVGVACLALLAGCGGGGETARISGKLTNNGQAIGGAHLVLQSQSNSADVFFGTSTPDGLYHIDYGNRGGLPPGRYTVKITFHTKIDGTPLPPGERGEAMIADGQAKRTVVTFQRELAPGSAPLDFELQDGKVQRETGDVSLETPEPRKKRASENGRIVSGAAGDVGRL